MSTVRTCTRAGPHGFTRLRSARRNRHTAVTAKRGHSEVVRFCAESNRLNPSSALPFVLGGHSTRPSSVLVDLECAAVPAETRWSERAATVRCAPTTTCEALLTTKHWRVLATVFRGRSAQQSS